jgi:hypothetical protein
MGDLGAENLTELGGRAAGRLGGQFLDGLATVK